LKKDEIRPVSIINEYIRLAKINTKVFSDNVSCEEIKYSTCGNKQEQSFNENGFYFELCSDCSNVFGLPRPVCYGLLSKMIKIGGI
jgi:hypothetical protein